MAILSESTRKFLIGYVFLVGLPLLGLVASLHSGQMLAAPASVDGIWNVSADGTRPNTWQCAELLAHSRELTMTISQSGNSLVISLPSDSLSSSDGQIENSKLTAASLKNLASAANTCSDGRPFSLAATIYPEGKPTNMVGKFMVEECASCPPLYFTAVRRSTNEQRGTR